MTNSLFDLSGWIALITGSTQGLGEATVRVLAEHGAHTTLRPSVNLPLYSTFKSAPDGMTKTFVLEFGSDGIRVNAVLPGLFATSLADAFTPEQKLKATQKTSLEPLRRPEEIGHAVLFLAPDTARHVTGASPVVDGGRTISN